jgi:hypothetical protein|tara:strand:- start:873 stop:1094 length:222 start_codon:yes stop_codon:yes gene_type:complete
MFSYNGYIQLLNDWNTSQVTTMEEMFYGISYQHTPEWDTSQVRNDEGMFWIESINTLIPNIYYAGIDRNNDED